MGKRGIQSAAKKAIKPRRASRAKVLPWNKKGLSRAAKVIAFCEFLPITAGIHAGRRLVLREWQKEIIRAIYATDETGKRKVRTALITASLCWFFRWCKIRCHRDERSVNHQSQPQTPAGPKISTWGVRAEPFTARHRRNRTIDGSSICS